MNEQSQSESPELRILVTMEGGVVTAVLANQPGIKVLLVDYDTAGAEDNELSLIPQDRGNVAEAIATFPVVEERSAFIDRTFTAVESTALREESIILIPGRPPVRARLSIPKSRVDEFMKQSNQGQRLGQAFYQFMNAEKCTQDKAWWDRLYEANDVIAKTMIDTVTDWSN